MLKIQVRTVIGAVGVSGARSADEDQELAVIGAEAAAAAAANGATRRDGPVNGATHFGRSQVEAKFREGGLLLDTPGYKIDAGRRTGPGEVECHEHVVDVMYVVHGTATVVTGGDTRHELGDGDVLAIPAGLTHQFTEVSDPFLYFVVKVED